MRKIYTTLAVILLAAASAFGQQREYTGNIKIDPLTLKQAGDSLYVGVKYEISGVKVDPKLSISLTPALVAMGHNDQLPSVMVMGRNSYNIHRRELALMSKRERSEYEKTAPYAIIKASSKKRSSTVDYKMTMPYESWMADARLDMQEYVSGCSSSPRLLAMSQLINKVQTEQPYLVTPYLAYIQPAVEAVKHREIEAEAFLDFVVSKIDIRPEYMNNPRELAKITDMINVTKNDPAITVRSISVVGYASPEGTLAFNKELSEGRANALVNYLVPRFDFPREYYKVVFGGENWDGLKKMVEESDMQYKQEVLHIIETVPTEINYQTNTSRKKQLMQLKGGDPYRYMLKEFFPSLRKAICKVDYDVRGFDVVEAAEIIKVRPQNLSLNEMYLVANTYTAGSEEFVNVFETAVRMFPQDETANLNAAAAALSRRDTVTAEKYLAKVTTETPEYNNAMGVLYMLKGDYDKAAAYLNTAIRQGIEVAKSNIAELNKKIGERR